MELLSQFTTGFGPKRRPHPVRRPRPARGSTKCFNQRIEPVNLEPDWGNIGPNLGMPSQFTDASGTFWDDPYGVCTSFAFTETSQQPISILLSGINFPVRTNNWTVTSTAPGHGTISNGSDVKQSQ